MYWKENGNCYSPLSEYEEGYKRAKMVCSGNYLNSSLISESSETILSFLNKDAQKIHSFWVDSAEDVGMPQLLNPYLL